MAPVRVTEDTARYIDSLVKELPKTDAYNFRRKAVTSEVTDVQATERVDTSRVTTRLMDRDCEIVLPEGIELDSYRQNPIVLWGHDQDRPCGKCLWIKPDADGLIAKTYYTPRPEAYQGEWLPDFVFSMVQAEVLKGKSIGFIPLEMREPEPAEVEANPAVQCVITRSLLLEYSVVSIPSNPAALVETVNKGFSLDNWGITIVGKTKKPTPKKPVQKKANVYGPMADAVKALKMDPNKIAEEAVAALLKRWEV
ncbi:hypothetical protein C1280_24140 [Gemmata obscuriglobus]|uniref:Prohead serine protease domain-containing protein n=1 Tax=Gemmata obscuriglobus TaxID=114 RepID=A0A2Z3GZ56_9BACT|nr:hypothetical protein C1280_24140 [Gemmata obscuriglobus]